MHNIGLFTKTDFSRMFESARNRVYYVKRFALPDCSALPTDQHIVDISTIVNEKLNTRPTPQPTIEMYNSIREYNNNQHYNIDINTYNKIIPIGDIYTLIFLFLSCY